GWVLGQDDALAAEFARKDQDIVPEEIKSKSDSEVIEFYYRYMAQGAISLLMDESITVFGEGPNEGHNPKGYTLFVDQDCKPGEFLSDTTKIFWQANR